VRRVAVIVLALAGSLVWSGAGAAVPSAVARLAGAEWRDVGAPPGPSVFSWDSVWTGKEIVALGPTRDEQSIVAEAYDPAGGRWRSLPSPPVSPRYLGSVVWTGSRVLVWGGEDLSEFGGPSDGALYNPGRNVWQHFTPPSPFEHTNGHVPSVWLGDRLVTFAGTCGATPPSCQSFVLAFSPRRMAWTSSPLPGGAPFDGFLAAPWPGTRTVVFNRSHSTDTALSATTTCTFTNLARPRCSAGTPIGSSGLLDGLVAADGALFSVGQPGATFGTPPTPVRVLRLTKQGGPGVAVAPDTLPSLISQPHVIVAGPHGVFVSSGPGVAWLDVAAARWTNLPPPPAQPGQLVWAGSRLLAWGVNGHLYALG
jgi:hypothetical protein